MLLSALGFESSTVSSNSKAVFSVASVSVNCSVYSEIKCSTYSGGSKMSGSAERQQSLCLLLEEGVSRKSRALRINFKSGWISSENVFVGPTRKGETIPKLTDLLKNELFVVLGEGESFSTRVCSPCRTKVRNCAVMLSQIREKLNKPTDNEQLLRLQRMSKSPHSNPLLRDLAL